jgi:CRP-like cAMP-binding protein
MLDIISLFRLSRRQTKTVGFHKNQFIFYQGSRSDSLFFIESGTVKLTVTSSNGKEALIGFYAGGDLFGESCLGSDDPRRFHNAIAATDLVALKIERDAVLPQLRSDTTAYTLLNWLLTRNRDMQRELAERLLDSSEQRLAHAISFVAHHGATKESGLPPGLTQQDFANMVGLSRQRVNVLMTRLKKSGVTDRNSNVDPRRPSRRRPQISANSDPEIDGQ